MFEIFWLVLWRVLLITLSVLAIAYFVAALYLLLRQTRFIFRPHYVIRATPVAFNLTYEEVWIPVSLTSDLMTPIHGWWIPSATPDAPVWLFLHGNGSNIGDELKRAVWFHHLGYSTLMVDYRGYGRSKSSFPTEASVYQDVEAVWHYLTQVRQIPPQQIFVYGHSLGGAIAIELATRHPELGGLAVEGTFTSMRAMVGHLYKQFSIFPVELILRQRFDSLSKVRSLSVSENNSHTMPILFIHGTIDRVVPAFMSQTLFEAAPEPKRLLLVPDAGHHDVGELGGVQYVQALQWVVEQAQGIFIHK